MSKRDVLLEMLILESKGFLGISSKRVIELCSGWTEGTCDDDIECRKYLEAYQSFMVLYPKYIHNNLHDFGIIEMFKEVNELMNSGYKYKPAIINMIRNKLSLIKIPTAEPPFDLLTIEFQEHIKVNPNIMDIYMFRGKIVRGIISLEISEE